MLGYATIVLDARIAGALWLVLLIMVLLVIGSVNLGITLSFYARNELQVIPVHPPRLAASGVPRRVVLASGDAVAAAADPVAIVPGDACRGGTPRGDARGPGCPSGVAGPAVARRVRRRDDPAGRRGPRPPAGSSKPNSNTDERPPRRDADDPLGPHAPTVSMAAWQRTATVAYPARPTLGKRASPRRRWPSREWMRSGCASCWNPALGNEPGSPTRSTARIVGRAEPLGAGGPVSRCGGPVRRRNDYPVDAPPTRSCGA